MPIWDYRKATELIASKLKQHPEFKTLYKSDDARLANTKKPLVVLIGDVHDSESIGNSNAGLLEDLFMDEDLKVQHTLLEGSWQADEDCKSTAGSHGRSFSPVKRALEQCTSQGKTVQALVSERLDDNINAISTLAFIAQTFLSNPGFQKAPELMQRMHETMLQYFGLLPVKASCPDLVKVTRDIARVNFKKLEKLFSPLSKFLVRGEVEPVHTDPAIKLHAGDKSTY